MPILMHVSTNLRFFLSLMKFIIFLDQRSRVVLHSSSSNLSGRLEGMRLGDLAYICPGFYSGAYITLIIAEAVNNHSSDSGLFHGGEFWIPLAQKLRTFNLKGQ